MCHCGSKPARYSWQCIAPKPQHQKYIAPNTKKQCTKDALHNSNRTNSEAPPKIPKVHTHNTKAISHHICSSPKKSLWLTTEPVLKVGKEKRLILRWGQNRKMGPKFICCQFFFEAKRLMFIWEKGIFLFSQLFTVMAGTWSGVESALFRKTTKWSFGALHL